MVMLRPKGKAQKIAQRVMKGKGIELSKDKSQKLKSLTQPFLQH